MIRVLVAEDSAVTREYLVYLLGQDQSLEVAGTARDGLEAVEQAERLKPDVILMDVHMPRMDGLEATRQIMGRVPTPIVMVSASSSSEEAAKAFEALKAGALTLMDKPGGPDSPDQAESTRLLVQTLKLMSEVKVVRRRAREERPTPPAPSDFKAIQKLRLIAVGASTGGPAALAEILGGLPADLEPALLVVQHIAPGFKQGLVDWLGHETRLRVKQAEAGERVRAASVYLAPDGFQMGITQDGRIHLSNKPAEDAFCPSASHLFESAAKTYGASALGVLLTGMGRDGAAGLLRLRQSGAVTIAQDEATSVVFGMPDEAIRLGAAQYVLSPRRISAAIRQLAPAQAGGDNGGHW